MDEDLAQVFLVNVSESRAEALMAVLAADVENVDYVDVNRSFKLDEPIVTGPVEFRREDVMENDPLVAEQWGLDAVMAHEAHALLIETTPAEKALVAIVDTGVDARHEDISTVFNASPGNTDLHGHGSHCAGLAGAVTNNGLGIASLNWEGRFVEVAGYKALNDSGMGTVESIAQSILDAARDGADVISMSLGGKSPTAPKTIVDAVNYAMRGGAIVIVSAGNADEDAIGHMPSNVPGVIVVSAVDENLRKASFSNTNTSLERPIAAPGVNILSLRSRGGYMRMSGTSMSTPIVSGLVGVMRALNPHITAAEAYRILQETGRDVPDTPRVGRLINAAEALQAVRSGS
jgi:thermitase